MEPKTKENRKVSVHDVAKHANVAPSTVSRALNYRVGSSSVSEETRQRVLAAAQKLGYKPNVFARSLRSQKSFTIGVIVSDVVDEHVAGIIAGAEQVIRGASYAYMLCSAGNSKEGQDITANLISQSRVDGILATSVAGPRSKDFVARLREQSVPVVLIGSDSMLGELPCVMTDNVKGGAMATEHLIGLGHQRIVYMRGGHYDSVLRYNGYRQALQAAGLKECPELVINGGTTPGEGYQAIQDFLGEAEAPTAVFCFDDNVAFGAMRALQEAGLRVPADSSVVGFNGIVFCEYCTPKLTTIAQPSFQMGRQGAQMLLEMIGGTSGETGRQVIFQPQLIVRESTGPCPDARS